MATVYKAYDPNTDRYVALKTMPQHYSQDATFRARFEREARAIARLEHIHILPVFAYGEDEGIAYMAMRYMDTGTLTERMRHGPMPFDEASRIVGQIASALDYAHNRGVIHRDVKPSNVLLDEAGNTYLTDFGIAKIVEGTLDLTGDSILGTPQYMSPEQCRGIKDLTPATDQYSLGVILYEMVTGRTPYQAETPLAVIHMQLMDAPLPPPRTLRHDLSEEAENVIFKALAREPEQRYPSCGAMAAAFAQAIHASQPAATVEHHESQPATAVGIQQTTRSPMPDRDTAILPSSQRRRPVWVFGVVVLLVIAVVIVGGLASGIIPSGGTEPTQVAQVAAETPTTVPIETPPLATSTPMPTLDAFGTAQAMNDAEATINAARTALYLDGLTMTATLWTATPTASHTPIPTLTHTPTATFTPSQTLTPSPTITPTTTPTEIPQSAILYEEDFEDGVADGWLVSRGTSSIQDDDTGNRVWSLSRDFPDEVMVAYLNGSQSWTDYAVQMNYYIVDAGNPPGGVGIRVRNPGHLCDDGDYQFFLGHAGLTVSRTFPNTICSQYETLGGSSINNPPGIWHSFYVEAHGSVLGWHFDNGALHQATDDTHPMGGIFINPYLVNEVWIDNIRVWSLGNAESQQVTSPQTSIIPGAEVTFRDDFDGTSLSSSWRYAGSQHHVAGGELLYEGDGNYNSIWRPGIHPNEGVLLLFQYDQAEMGFEFTRGDWDTDDYRRWGIVLFDEIHGEVDTFTGRSNTFRSVQTFFLNPNTRYYALLRVGENGRFSSHIWEPADPSGYVLAFDMSPEGGGWDNQIWDFNIKVDSGTFRVDSYEELSFPADFEMPATPPTTP